MPGEGDTAAESVVAVIVAYQRAAMLHAALDAVAAQTRRPDRVIVVDNASTDGSAEVARDHPLRPAVVALDRNTGGAGGFTVGLASAIVDESADLIWLMDDDTVPTATALERLLAARDAYDGRLAALASRVVWSDGRSHPMNTPRTRPGASARDRALAQAAGGYPVRSMSFVSMLVEATAVRDVGLPIADYFLWNDDFEFSARLLRHKAGIYVIDSVVEHRTKTFGGTDVDPGERFRHEVRNKLWLLSSPDALSPVERILYGGSTVRRWVRTWRMSADRATLRRAARFGLADAVNGRPRHNLEVLAGLGAATAAVGTLEAPMPGPLPLGHGDSDEPFSVLMPVYSGDKAEHVERALCSVTDEQTLRPDQLVVVLDGPVSSDVARVVATHDEATSVPVTVVRLARNRGLATALQEGLAACKFDIVARADADDISLPERFAQQVPLIRDGYDLIGSAITEFNRDEHDLGVTRVQPVTASEIRRYARFHDPFNHPSVVYRKHAVEAAGGYEHLALMEDYLLFSRMITAGARVGNVRESLVLYRIGAGAYARRGGRRLLRSEVALQRQLHHAGFTSRVQFARNVAVRGGYRLAPESLRKVAYRTLIVARRSRRST